MTDTELALLRAIAAHPDEDTPRLAYADYLDELGGECETARAEYIRIQITRQRGLADAATDAELYCREVALYVAYAGTWRRELAGYEVGVVAARRGFWHKARARATTILAAANNPFAHLIDELSITGPVHRDQFDAILRLPHVPRLVSLRVPWSAMPIGQFGPTTAVALTRAGLLRLELLDLSGHAIGDEGVRALCAPDCFPALRELHLFGNGITAAGADALLNSALLPQLRRLNLQRNPISGPAVRRLVARLADVIEVSSDD